MGSMTFGIALLLQRMSAALTLVSMEGTVEWTLVMPFASVLISTEGTFVKVSECTHVYRGDTCESK